MIRILPARTRLLPLTALTAAVVALAPTEPVRAQENARTTARAQATLQPAETEHTGAAALGLELRRLGTTKRVLMVAAHPDDENTAVLATLALGHGAEVAYLSLTRGEGGQNGIGPELGTGLGLIRSEELLAARRLDGARQFFTRAIDYGYSKNAGEAFRHWPRDSIVADAVGVIRRFRPDVVVTIWSGTPRDGHGQHEAAGVVVRDAFEAAGDPSRFPEQMRAGLRPHSPAKLYQSHWRSAPDDAIPLETGEYDELFGRSYYQIAMDSRSRHRSQDQGRRQAPGPRAYRVSIARVNGGLPPGPSLFTGLDTTLTQRARGVAVPSVVEALSEYETAVGGARESFNPLEPRRAVPELARALGALRRADALLERAARERGDDAAERLRPYLLDERRKLNTALAHASGLVFEATASTERVVPGQTVTLELSLWNGGGEPVRVQGLEPALPPGWTAAPEGPGPRVVAAGARAVRAFRVTVPDDAAPTRPYFLERAPDGDIYRWPDDPGLRGMPFDPAAVGADARVEVAGRPLELATTADYVRVDPHEGESRRPLRVVPAVSVRVEPRLLVLPLDGAGEPAATGAADPDEHSPTAHDGAAVHDGAPAPRTLEFAVRLDHQAPDATAGTLRVEPPAGWTADPARASVSFDGPGAEAVVRITLRPPADVEPGAHRVRAIFEGEHGRSYTSGYDVVDYPHIRPHALYEDATTAVHAFEVAVPAGLDVAYIPGAGDAVPEALAQLGITAEVIEPARLSAADLGGYDVVITGVRAYEVRPEVRAAADELIDYARAGGTLIVQYNKYPFFVDGSYGPYPMTVNRPHDRVTDETAPVRVLEPGHPVLTRPNRIMAAAWEGWVQERGLYFAHEWDERYTPLLAMSDPGEEPLEGSLLVADVGAGTYVYTGIAFFRQLPAGVPGAYRLLANLLALGAE